MNRRSGIAIIGILGISCLGTSGVAWGWFGHEHGHQGGPFGPQAGAERVIERLVHPCRAGCFDTSRTCFKSGVSNVPTCVTGKCASEVTAAQVACKSGETSGCREAMNTLRICSQPCTDTIATSQATCRTTMMSCLSSCGQS